MNHYIVHRYGKKASDGSIVSVQDEVEAERVDFSHGVLLFSNIDGLDEEVVCAYKEWNRVQFIKEVAD